MDNKITVVYIACPYTNGDVAVNVRESIIATDKLRALGFLPFNPQFTHFWHLLVPHTYEYWTKMDMEWLGVCDCILRLPGESSGADEEVKKMRELGKPVYYNIESLIAKELNHE